MKEALVIYFIFQILFVFLGIVMYEPCFKIPTFAEVWNKKTQTKNERLIVKPLVLFMSPGMKLGMSLAKPSRCGD